MPPVRAAFSTGPTLQIARISPAVVAFDGDVLAIGGENAEGPLRSMESWTPGESRWTARATMKVPRTLHTATVLADDAGVLITGGGGAHRDARLAERWTGMEFVLAGRMTAVRSRGTATLLADGRVTALHTPRRCSSTVAC